MPITQPTKIVAFFTDIAQDLRLYAQDIARCMAPPRLPRSNPRRGRLIENELRDFKLGGAELAEDDKARLKVVNEELAELSTRFEEHLLDATNAWGISVEDESRAGRRARRRDGGRAVRGASRGQARLEAHAAHAVLSARHAICARSRTCAAGCTRPTPRARPNSVPKSGMGQRPGRRTHPALAPRGGGIARLPQLRRGLAGAEDGAIARRSFGVPA